MIEETISHYRIVEKLGGGGMGDLAAGKYDMWLQENEAGYRLSHQAEYEAMFQNVAKVFAQSGGQPAVRALAEQMKESSQHRYEDPAWIGFVYAKAGNKDQAFAWLEKGFNEKSNAMQYLKTSDLVDSLRSDPRYMDLLKRMGMPQ